MASTAARSGAGLLGALLLGAGVWLMATRPWFRDEDAWWGLAGLAAAAATYAVRRWWPRHAVTAWIVVGLGLGILIAANLGKSTAPVVQAVWMLLAGAALAEAATGAAGDAAAPAGRPAARASRARIRNR